MLACGEIKSLSTSTETKSDLINQKSKMMLINYKNVLYF